MVEFVPFPVTYEVVFTLKYAVTTRGVYGREEKAVSHAKALLMDKIKCTDDQIIGVSVRASAVRSGE